MIKANLLEIEKGRDLADRPQVGESRGVLVVGLLESLYHRVTAITFTRFHNPFVLE